MDPYCVFPGASAVRLPRTRGDGPRVLERNNCRQVAPSHGGDEFLSAADFNFISRYETLVCSRSSGERLLETGPLHHGPLRLRTEWQTSNHADPGPRVHFITAIKL